MPAENPGCGSRKIISNVIGLDLISGERFASDAGEHEDAGRAGILAHLNVGTAVTDHEAARQVKMIFPSCVEEELWFRFAAVAIVFGLMRTHVIPVEAHARFGQKFVQVRVDGFDGFASEQSSAHPGLIRNDKKFVAGILQSLKGCNGAGDENNLVDRGDIGYAVLRNCSITVEKNGSVESSIRHRATNLNGLPGVRKQRNSNYTVCRIKCSKLYGRGQRANLTA